jgi:hypothetical protein
MFTLFPLLRSVLLFPLTSVSELFSIEVFNQIFYESALFWDITRHKFLSFQCVTGSAYLMLDFIILTLLDEGNIMKTLCNILHPRVTSGSYDSSVNIVTR